MAFASDSTTAPESHRALLLQRVCDSVTAGIGRTLDRMGDAARAAVEGRIKPARDAAGRFCKRPDLAALSPADDADLNAAIGALFAEIGIGVDEASSATEPDAVKDVRCDLDALIAATEPRAELPPEPLLPAADLSPAREALHDRAGCVDIDTPPAPATCGDITTPEPGTASIARTLHLRRQLAEAAEHGAALLAALGLRQLVGPDTIIVDPVAAGDALDLAIATLDAFDGDTDIEDGGDDEPSLAWVDGQSEHCGDYQDRELDTADAEPSLASPERHPEVPVSTWGCSWTARGGSEGQLRWAEGLQDDREKVDEDGPIDDDELDGAGDVDPEPSIGWPEDFTAEVVPMLEASADAELDDIDREDDELGDDRDPEPIGWVFGPSRTEAVHA